MDRAEIDHRLRSLNVLVVEDNFLVALALQQTLVQHGCRVIGPVATVEEGTCIAEQQDLDVAILDINIKGGTSEPIAAALERRGLPFFFVSGYGSPKMLPDRLRSVARLSKPVDVSDLLNTLAQKLRPMSN